MMEEKFYYKVICDALEIEYKYTSLRTAKSVASRIANKHRDDVSCENISVEVVEYVLTYKNGVAVKSSHKTITSYD